MPDQSLSASVWFKRFINFLGILFSYGISVISGRYWHAGMPAALSVEPTNLCNLRCPECPAGRQDLDRPRGVMAPDTFRSILEQAKPYSAYLTLYFQGEPYLNPIFLSMVTEARAAKLFTLTSTNGHFLDEENARKTIESGLNRIIISFDGADQESYSVYRSGGEYELVASGIRNLVSARKARHSASPVIILQCLMLSSNEKQLENIRKTGKHLGADKVTFKTAQFYEFEKGNVLMPVEGMYSRYKEVKQQGTGEPGHPITRSLAYEIKNPLRNQCFRMWSSCVVTWDGRVVPCCFDKDAEHEMGNLNSQSLEEIWHGEKFSEFRRRVLTDRKSIDICRNCTQMF